ncbi:MAG: hypothetical protein HZA10_03640 [Nitrospirae bacterium]|nr:hypothetical protein [Nitrospirota bacterium]
MLKVKNDIEIRDLGMKSLIKTLGYTGMIRFLRQFSKGSGNYLELQEKIFKGMTVDEIYEKAKKHYEKKQRKT